MYSETYKSGKRTFIYILLAFIAGFCLLSVPNWIGLEQFVWIYELAVLIATVVFVYHILRISSYTYIYYKRGRFGGKAQGRDQGNGAVRDENRGHFARFVQYSAKGSAEKARRQEHFFLQRRAFQPERHGYCVLQPRYVARFGADLQTERKVHGNFTIKGY